ncbi:uncharacterized protein AAGF69_005608 isoform 1-T2 [Amazona ochrocephala]
MTSMPVCNNFLGILSRRPSETGMSENGLDFISVMVQERGRFSLNLMDVIEEADAISRFFVLICESYTALQGARLLGTSAIQSLHQFCINPVEECSVGYISH